MGICSGISTEWLYLHPPFPMKLEFKSIGYCGMKKIEESGDKPSENQQRARPTYLATYTEMKSVKINLARAGVLAEFC